MLVLKKEGGRVEDYRGVMLTQTAYKVYTSVLAERLREGNGEERDTASESNGLQKGRRAIDQIYVLNFMMNRRVLDNKGKLVVLFVNMKAAFNSVDRDILLESIRSKGVREGLVVRCKEMLKETVVRVRVGNKQKETFRTGRGVRQRCPLSLSLFTLVIADLDEKLEKGGMGRVKVGRKNLFISVYGQCGVDSGR